MDINGVEIEDTFAEGFPIKVGRVLVTAITERWAMEAAREATGFGTSVIMCPAEAGIERLARRDETPDGRPGVYIQICNMSFKNLEGSLLARIGQCILTAPTTAVFNGLPEAEKQFDTGAKLKFFGDGFQKEMAYCERGVCSIPVMSGDFIVEEKMGAVDGIAGGNFYIMAENQASALMAAEAAVDAIREVEGTITPFPGGVVSSGSKVGSRYKFLKASTNERFCPTLKDEGVCILPPEIRASYEVVINGVSREAIEESMRAGITAACTVPGVVKISAGNFEGNLGPHLFKLQEILG
ncbi:MAG: formylmethanofuran--tetrahydromethanopterin N-formyltransferase [Methanothrix sp.]|jgi:formylmethanofuran--tetrahydromethanopterin N-formyltransferase|uniref:Formylmethanofuran--tetrahydromethanopterin formyltransferase n=1 Tax=Methanothrix harundinacea TaxID=301375 RepID=A0A101FTU6_9EURY|nr:MAG: Formylmethanofuran--tetrahydromethanopterin formyltransferase [Methanothrix harundinacea]MDD2638878.1 formylmethanofuran--tetrahydromethanopterin N-formyltransferase [Methanothrix sp.]MDI9400177.1 formylmethanofuran--tetrahydromethanopterin N-formyltransferase [Euryarchaeota archaeon]KUK96599.1 MAG: Formylmethanofuran--tetrahydromethanopterin formyltransferase [Methanothrix harundinacea]MCP1392676.1 formylmethanofuran--tetrahydromethanopterin N-formyltransferase [Methanothrix harundinac